MRAIGAEFDGRFSDSVMPVLSLVREVHDS
jgi:hypothetical protein